MSKVGDFSDKGMDPLDTYLDIVSQGTRLPQRKWIVQPQWNPPSISGLEQIQKFYEGHMLPREWQLLADLWTKFQCGTYFVKRPNWIEPPITAENIDLRNVVTIDSSLYLGFTIVLDFTCPDRYVGTIPRFGQGLSNPANWGFVNWIIQINGRPVRNYNLFTDQIGTTVDPTEVPVPFKLKGGDRFQVLAQPFFPTPQVNVFARAWGWIFPAKKVTQDGSFADYHTL